MGQIGAVQIADGQFAEDIVKDRGRVLDAVIALHHPRRLEAGEGEGVHEFLQRHAVLQAHGHGDGEIVHHRPEARAFLVHVDEDLAQLAVIVFAGAQIDLVPADDGLLRIALAALRQFLAVAADDLADDDLLDDLLGQNGRLLAGRALGQDLFGLVVILDQGAGQRLAELRAVAIERVGLDPQRMAEFIGRQRIGDGRGSRHVDRLADRARDEALGRRHHADMAFDRQIAAALLAAGIGAVEDRQMRGFQMRRAFQRHGAADMIVRGLDLGAGEAQMAQQVKARIGQLVGGDAKRAAAEFLAKRPLVEDEADVEGRGQSGLDLLDLGQAEAVAGQRGVVDGGAVPKRAVADRMGHDLDDLTRGIAKRLQRGGHRLVDDLEIAAARQLLELDQREIGLDPGRVAIHHQTDRAGGRDHGRLRVAVAMRLAQGQRLVPGLAGQGDQRAVGTIGRVQGHGRHVDALAGRAMGGGAVVADHAQHVVAVARIAREGAQFGRHLGAGRIGHAGHHRRQGPAERAALIAVIAQPHVHQQTADIGIAQTKRAEIMAALRDLAAGELRHQHADLQRHGPQPHGMDIGARVEALGRPEGQQVHRGQVAGRVVQEHVFAARIAAADRPVLGAGMPGVDRVMELDAGIGAGPCGMADLVPKLAGRDGLGDLAVGAAHQLPGRILAHGAQEGVGHADRIVRVLPRDAGIGLAVPVRVIGRELDAVEALLGVLQHAVHVGLGDHRALGAADRGLQGGVQRGVGLALARADGGKDRVQLALVHLRAGDEAGHLLLLDDLPVDEGFDIGVIHVADHHLGRPPRGAARLDRARRAVADLQEAHQPRGLAATRQAFPLAAQRREVRARAAAIFEQARLADPEVHDPALVHQIVADRLDEAGMGLGMFIGAVRADHLAGLVIDIEMPLPRSVDAVGPVQAGVEPLRAVRGAHLAGQHVAHLVQIGAGILLGREVAALPAPIGPGPRHAVKDLGGAGLASVTLVLGQVGQGGLVGDMAPQEVRHTLFAHRLQPRGNARLAEILLRDDIACDLAPALGDFHAVIAEHDRAVGVADLAGGRGKGDPAIGPALCGGEAPFDLHVRSLPCSAADAPKAKSHPPAKAARRAAPGQIRLS